MVVFTPFNSLTNYILPLNWAFGTKSAKNRERKYMPLIKKIYEATVNRELPQPFTVQDLKHWMKDYQIVKDDGGEYAESSINAILSNSDTKNSPTTNLNIKVLQSHINEDGKHKYWF